MALADFQRIDHYGDPAGEARACRSACALFDFSFLECVRIRGGAAREIVEAFTGRSLAGLPVGKIRYALRVGPAGHVLADLTIWRTDAETFEVMSGRHEDIFDLMDWATSSVTVTAVADRATLALQGPASLDALRHLGNVDAIEPLTYFGFIDAALDDTPCRIGRIGYTGEPGFEIICPLSKADRIRQALARHARLAGFIALDILRIEAGFVLFSNEFRVPVTPVEAGLGKFNQTVHLLPPHLTLISFCADADHLDWPWQPGGPLQRPATPGEIVVTSACENIVAGGVLGLGYVLNESETVTALRDPTGIFRNIRWTPLPYYDTAKSRPRLPWREVARLGAESVSSASRPTAGS